VVLNRFEAAMAESKAAICKSIAAVGAIVENDNVMYINYYKAVYSQARIPEDNEWDASRESYDSALYPYYYREITFAALTLNNRGVSGYGDFCLTLNSRLIANRAAVFETNSFNFIKKQMESGGIDPAGYRSSWPLRAKLAVAKLGGSLTISTVDALFPVILLGSGERAGDFMEVHIYGSIHRRAIERVVRIGKKVRRQDAVLIKSMKRKLTEFGADYEEAP